MHIARLFHFDPNTNKQKSNLQILIYHCRFFTIYILISSFSLKNPSEDQQKIKELIQNNLMKPLIDIILSNQIISLQISNFCTKFWQQLKEKQKLFNLNQAKQFPFFLIKHIKTSIYNLNIYLFQNSQYKYFLYLFCQTLLSLLFPSHLLFTSFVQLLLFSVKNRYNYNMEQKSNIQTSETETPIKQEQQVTNNEQPLTNTVIKNENEKNVVISNQSQQQQQLQQATQYDPNAFLEDYLKTEQKLYIEYLQEDYSRQFKLNEYLQWRVHKVNQFKNKISNYHKLITQKYLYETFLFNKEGDISISYNGYNSLIPIYIQEYPYISFYLYDVERNNWEVSDYNYRCYESSYRNRQNLIQAIRSIVREGSEYTYNQLIFNEYASTQSQISAEGYKSYFREWEIIEEQTKAQEQKKINQLISSIENINLYVFQEYKLQCENYGVLTTKEGYLEYEANVKTTYSTTYLEQLNQDLIEQKQQLEKSKKQKTKVIVNDLNQDQQEYLQGIQGAQRKQEDEEEEIEAETQIIKSSSCQCCNGKPYDCEGQACQLLGNCICISIQQ